MALPGTWATIADVSTFTGATVVQGDVDAAQVMTEGLINRVYRSNDVNSIDYYWLQRAVAWQAKFVSENQEVLSSANIVQMSQDGFSVTFNVSPDGQSMSTYSQIAMRFLNNMRNGSNTSIRFNSGFQKEPAYGRYGWRSI